MSQKIKIVTIKDASGVEMNALRFGAKVLQVSDKTKELNNDKKTLYRLATIEFENNRGESKRATALIFENNFKHGIKVNDEEYMCTGVPSEDGKTIYVQLSHLIHGAGSVSLADFGDFDMSALKATTTAKTEVENVATATT